MPKIKPSETASRRKDTIEPKTVSTRHVPGEKLEPVESREATLEVKNDNYVYVEKSVTKNLGDYNSAKVTVGVRLQVNPTPAELTEINVTIEHANRVVDEEIEKQIKALE